MDYTVKKGFRGKLKVAFRCPRCNLELESPLEEAGNRCPCPTCQHEFVVPGIEELKKVRAEEAAMEEEQMREAVRKEAEERAEEAQRANQAAARARLEAEAARARQAEKAKHANTPSHTVSVRTFAGTIIVVAISLMVVMYFTMVRPLQVQLDELTATVNHNAEVANRTTDTLARALAETDRIAQNANRFAHSHSRF